MADDARIRQLLEELAESGQTPEQVCAHTPELLPEVRARWLHLRELEAQVEALFPASPSGGARRAALASPSAELPSIPGYEIESLLGAGGMGVVYKARHLKLRRPVAIKMLLAGAYATPQELECLLREAAAVGGLRHPSIVQVYDVGEVSGLPYFTMEFMEGGTLARKLAGVPQAPRDAATAVATVARAVHAAHLGGVVHRDLKPANILLDADGALKVADFSLARTLGGENSLSMFTARVGTPSYMAPEQVSGDRGAFQIPVDIYALGALLYEALTGRPPFRSESALETQRQVLSRDPAPPSTLNARVPRDLETITLKALAKDPRARYVSALALAEDLERFLSGETILARRAGPIERTVKWCRRRPARATALAAACAITLSALGASLWIGAHRATIAREVRDDLHELSAHAAASRWDRARAVLERAQARVTRGGGSELLGLLADAETRLDLADRLSAIRFQRASAASVDFNRSGADAAYVAAFRAAGIAEPSEPAAVVAARIRASEVRAAIVDAFDDWAYCATDIPRRFWILEVATLSDPDPAWRDKVRNPAYWTDRATLSELAAAADLRTQSIPLMLVLVSLLDSTGGDSLGFLKRVQWAHPEDFWTNFLLGEMFQTRGNAEALVYYQAAIALRPSATAPYINIGITLGALDRYPEAMPYFRRAVEIEPKSTAAHYNLALAASRLKLNAETRKHAAEAARLTPKDASSHGLLAYALRRDGEYASAKAEYEIALDLGALDENSHEQTKAMVEFCDAMIAIEGRLPALLTGAERVASPEESVYIGTMLIRSERYADALRFYQDALAAPTAEMNDPALSLRYNAACAVLMAGTASDLSTTKPREHAARIGMALDWLIADLAAWRRNLETGGPHAPAEVAAALRHWLGDADLAAVREPFPAAATKADIERAKAMWAEVKALRSLASPSVE